MIIENSIIDSDWIRLGIWNTKNINPRIAQKIFRTILGYIISI
jgi:hypothetical protein